MTKLRGALCAAVLALTLLAMGAGTALAQSRPVAFDNTPITGFAAADTCNCHSNFIQEWRQSMHAKALSDPIFQVKLGEAKTAGGAPLAGFCLKCHGPVGTMTNQLGNVNPGTAAADAIPCSFCHQATGNGAPTNNVSLLIDPSGTYRAQISTPTAPHPTAYSPFHNSSDICGSCHNVSHPGNGLPIEATFTEWQASPQAKAGVTCQDCHMSQAPGQIGPSVGWDAGGGPRRPVYQMNFMGAQVGLGNPVVARQMLQSAAKVEMVAPEILDGARDASVTVSVTNVGAGHDLPTGLTEVREMWLDVTFTDVDGKTTQIGRHVYGTVLKDAAGKYPATFWNATGVQSDDRIPPMGTSVSSFKFTFPGGVDNGRLKAQLLYRSVPDPLAKTAKANNPVTVMAESEANIYVSTDAERKANGVYLAAASASPLMPLVFAILGMAVCVGLIIFFVMWGRRPLPKRPTGGDDGTGTKDEAETREAEPSEDRAAATGAAVEVEPDAAANQPTQEFPAVKADDSTADSDAE